LAIYIIELRSRGLSYARISDVLNEEGVPTPMGSSCWQKSHVDRLLHTKYVRDILRELDGATKAWSPIQANCLLLPGSANPALAGKPHGNGTAEEL
jgi:hypothetical protein